MTRIEEIIVRESKATKGKWDVTPLTQDKAWIYTESIKDGSILADMREGHMKDASFIAHARTDIPYLTLKEWTPQGR